MFHVKHRQFNINYFRVSDDTREQMDLLGMLKESALSRLSVAGGNTPSAPQVPQHIVTILAVVQ
jgi:hypothetical protein